MSHEKKKRIAVRVSGHLRRFTSGEREMEVEPQATVREVFSELAAASPELRAALFKDSGEPNNQVLVFVDDEQSNAGHPLADARSVTLMLPISGG